MKTSIVFVIVALAAVVYAQESYPTKFDNIDVDGILASERLFNNYMECLQEKGKCTADGEELKKHLGDAIETCCTKCSEKQKEGVVKVYKHLESKKPALFDELKQKFDPSGEKEKECRQKLSL